MGKDSRGKVKAKVVDWVRSANPWFQCRSDGERSTQHASPLLHIAVRSQAHLSLAVPLSPHHPPAPFLRHAFRHG